MAFNRLDSLCDENEDLDVDASSSTVIGIYELTVYGTVILQVCIFCYLIFQLYIRKHCKKIPLKFQLLMLTYHIACIIANCIGLAPTVTTSIFEINDIYDYSTVYGCVYVVIVSIGPGLVVYSCVVLFWLLRLQVVFNGTIYQPSRRCNLYVLSIIGISVLFGIIFLTVSLIMFVFELEQGNLNNIFCLTRVKVLDFALYWDKKDYQYKMDHFYVCQAKSDHIIGQLSYCIVFVGMVSIPLINGILCYLYVSKFRSLVGYNQVTIQNDEMIKCQKKHVYINLMIGIITVSSTFIVLLLNGIQFQWFASLFAVDLLINALCMFMVFEFGEWMFCGCCFACFCLSNKK